MGTACGHLADLAGPEGISFPGHYETIPPVYAELIRLLTDGEDVNINVWDGEMEAAVRQILTKAGTPLERVHFHHFPAYEPWCRDHGPIFLVREKNGSRERAVVDWAYNAWGGKYPPCDLDDAIPQHVAKLRGLPLFSPGIVMEGGSLEVNGTGTVLTTTPACSIPIEIRTWVKWKLKNIFAIIWAWIRFCGWARESWATIRTATSTI